MIRANPAASPPPGSITVLMESVAAPRLQRK
jgi:hypothetical protein